MAFVACSVQGQDRENDSFLSVLLKLELQEHLTDAPLIERPQNIDYLGVSKAIQSVYVPAAKLLSDLTTSTLKHKSLISKNKK